MEDEEYFFMMLEDMERLERVHHHHQEFPDTRIPPPNDRLHSPWVSGLRLALNEAVKKLRAGTLGTRGPGHSGGRVSSDSTHLE